MAGRITISPEQVDQVAAQFKQSSEESRQIIAGLTHSIQQMEGEWEGMSKERFVQQFQEADKQMKSFMFILENISQELTLISQKFRTIDQSR